MRKLRRSALRVVLSAMCLALGCSSEHDGSKQGLDLSKPDGCGAGCVSAGGATGRGGGAGVAGTGGTPGTGGESTATSGGGGSILEDAGDAAVRATPGYVACPFAPGQPPARCSTAAGDYCCHYVSPGFSLPVAECNSKRRGPEQCFFLEYCDDDADCGPGGSCVYQSVLAALISYVCVYPPRDSGVADAEASTATPSDASSAD
jgi:hypothetical protein